MESSDASELTIASSADALRRVANYVLPATLDRRMLELGERKDTLSQAERDELLSLVEFAQDHLIEKIEAEVTLRELDAPCPIVIDKRE